MRLCNDCAVGWMIQASSPGRDNIPYILESNLHPFYFFRGLKHHMWIRIAVVSWIFEK